MIKRNFVLIVGIAIPLLCIILVVLAVEIPALSVKPQYDFLYTITDPNAPQPYYPSPISGLEIPAAPYANSYKIVGGKLTLVPISGVQIVNGSSTAAAVAPQIYFYDVKDNSSKQIDLADAEAFTLSAGPTSPDGYNILPQDENGGGFLDLFGGGDYDYGYVISKGGGAKLLTAIDSGEPVYDQSFALVGWIIK